MEKGKIRTSQDVKTGLQIEADTPTGLGESRQAADDKTRQDADEKLPRDNNIEPEKRDTNDVDDMMQGKHLEKKYRGGDTTDVDEYND